MGDEKEGPVTKSIRLTSSLILKNLVMYSNIGKRYTITKLFLCWIFCIDKDDVFFYCTNELSFKNIVSI